MTGFKHIKTRIAKTRKEKEVWEACNVLDKTNTNLTYYAIGEQLVKLGYKRGSNSDIRRYLTTWKKYHISKRNHATTSQSAEPQSSFSTPETSDNTSDLTHEHEPLRTDTNMSVKPVQTVMAQPSLVEDREILKLAQHYATQFDKLIKVIESLRSENQKLRDRLGVNAHKQACPSAALPKDQASKPRYKLKAVFG